MRQFLTEFFNFDGFMIFPRESVRSKTNNLTKTCIKSSHTLLIHVTLPIMIDLDVNCE